MKCYDYYEENSLYVLTIAIEKTLNIYNNSQRELVLI